MIYNPLWIIWMKCPCVLCIFSVFQLLSHIKAEWLSDKHLHLRLLEATMTARSKRKSFQLFALFTACNIIGEIMLQRSYVMQI